jgi:hypothetical protein
MFVGTNKTVSNNSITWWFDQVKTVQNMLKLAHVKCIFTLCVCVCACMCVPFMLQLFFCSVLQRLGNDETALLLPQAFPFFTLMISIMLGLPTKCGRSKVEEEEEEEEEEERI